MNKTRPVNLNLFKFRFPVTAIISILHRISGFIVFLLIPLFLWLLHKSLASDADFQALQQIFTSPWFRFLIWILLSSLLFHLVAGIRHLTMDMGWGESLAAGRFGAYLAIVVAAVLIILAGVWLW